MAIRYSGDCEIRITRFKSGFAAAVRAPKFMKVCFIDAGAVPGPLRLTREKLSKLYDAIALAALLKCLREKNLPVDRRRGKVAIDRLFKAPCPVV